MSIKHLDVFFNPKKIAVIGASEDPKRLGYHVFRNLVGKGFRGVVFPVHPTADGIQGVEAHRNINAVPHPVDLAIVANDPSEFPGVLDECGQKDVKGVVLLAPDFDYRVADPDALKSRITELSSIYGFRMLGPNSLGFLRPSKHLNASLYPLLPQRGNIAFISQAGTFSSAFLERAVSRSVGFSYFISLGYKLDIDFSDLIDFLGFDMETRAIILFMQHVTRGRKFLAALRSFANMKPIIVVRSGTYGGHAGTGAGVHGPAEIEDGVYEAVLKRGGAVRIDEMLDLYYMTEALAKQKRPRGKRLAVVTNSRSSLSIVVDCLLRQGGELATLGRETTEGIRTGLPVGSGAENPVHLLSEVTPAAYENALTSCMKDPDVDGVLALYLPYPGVNPREIASSIASASKARPDLPILSVLLGAEQIDLSREFLTSHGIPTFVAPEQAIRCFLYMYQYDYNLKLLRETPEAILVDFTPDVEKVRRVIERSAERNDPRLHLEEVREIIGVYGIPMIETHSAADEEEAARIASAIGYPVVMRVECGNASGKEHVFPEVLSEPSVRTAYRRLRDAAAASGCPDGTVIVQRKEQRHTFELTIEARRDPGFGSVIIFGTGGGFLEAMSDYAIGLPPLNQTLARRMMEETRIYRHLQHLPAYEDVLKQLEEIIVRFSQLVIDFPQIKEMEINPVIISEDDCRALYCRALIDEAMPKDYRVFQGDFCPPHLSICPYPYKYVREMSLGDGTDAMIRPIRGEDEPLIDRLFKSLSEETIMNRFCQKITEFSHERLVRFCQIDYDREMAFVAAVRDGENREEIIGVVRMIKLPDLENAEVSILISDDWQGRGVGKILMEYMINVSREIGLKTVWMEILKSNRRMLKLGSKYGFRQAYDDEDMVRVVLQL